MTYIKGNYKRSIYSKNGYIIGLFKVLETNNEHVSYYINKTITFTGYFQELNENDSYIFYGDDLDHPKYGFQFNVTKYEKIKPNDIDGIVEFLSSDLFKGIGVKQAKLIVDTLGINCLEKIEEHKEILYTVPKLTDKKIETIYSVITNNDIGHKTVIKLSNLGFSNKDSIDIYNMYKTSTMDIINKDIYRLIDDLSISFRKVDLIAMSLNYEYDSISRIQSCIVYVMNSLIYSKGDTYLTFEEIYDNVINYLNISIDYDKFSYYLAFNKVIRVDDKYYLKDIYDSQDYIISRINYLNNLTLDNFLVDNYLDNIQKELSIIYNDKQKYAIKKSINNNLLIITGGPGTGKTTIIKAILECYKLIHKLSYDDVNLKVALLAPTGRASKRMSQSTLYKASTIHRFLKWNKETNEFSINEKNISNVDMIIVDEASMIDISLFASLLKGIKRTCKIVLVGDYNQLPSVGPGEVLKDLIDSNIIDTIKLDLLYRQSDDSYINVLASEIKNNDLTFDFKNKSDFKFLESNNILNDLQKLCEILKEKGVDNNNLQILCPMYSTVFGIDNLNKILQKIFNEKDDSKREIKYGDVILRENDKILQLVNDPDNNVFNGDIGYIKYILFSNTSKSGKNEIYIDFDGNIVKYLPKDLINIKHGYVISIHKSQGSEFDNVIIPICGVYKRMLYKKLIYTAITRAKKNLFILGDINSFIYSVNNEYNDSRKSDLLNNLLNSLNNY